LASRVDGYAALQQWRAGRQLQSRNFFLNFFLFGSFNGLFYARQKENDKLLYVQVRVREKEKKRAKKRKKERALKPVWSSSSQLLVLLLQS
jgi:hypothetical protein